MTITTNTYRDEDEKTGTVEDFANTAKLGIAYPFIFNDGARVFLGVQGHHGTDIRMDSKQERITMATLLRQMADNIDPDK